MILKTTTDGTSRVAEIQCSVDEMKELMKDGQMDKVFKAVELTTQEQEIVKTAIEQQVTRRWLMEHAEEMYGQKGHELHPFGKTYLP